MKNVGQLSGNQMLPNVNDNKMAINCTQQDKEDTFDNSMPISK